MGNRVLAIALDGFEESLALSLMASGQMPALAALREKSARFGLDHESAQFTGLAGEHVSSGLSPQRAGRPSVVYFDKGSYGVWQVGAQCTPFPAALKARTVVFDIPYFDLGKAPQVTGVTAWGGHDPGTDFRSSPDGLADELLARFGPYPASRWIYGFAWPSAERCRTMGDALTAGADLRARAVQWLLTERFPDWDLAMVGVSESHSALEALWHGIDENHPLHGHPSAAAAGEGIASVYRAIDRLIGDLATTFPDAAIVVFSMHGMGPNESDVPSMVLLPELLCRYMLGKSVLVQNPSWNGSGDGVPILGEDDNWSVKTKVPRSPVRRFLDSAAKRMPARLRGGVRRSPGGGAEIGTAGRTDSIDWLPGARYQPLWHEMRAFALPSFYDGRIRINLEGREGQGLVSLDNYDAVCDEIEQMLAECCDPATGVSVVDRITRNGGDDPRELGPWSGDLDVMWTQNVLAFDHPRVGRIGPVPYRRTGGHTGDWGMAYLCGPDIAPGDLGQRSAFDVIPTLIDLLGEDAGAKVCGRSLLPAV